MKKMKLKALSLALLALPIASFAEEPVPHHPTDVSFSVEAEKEVERDLLQVSLFTKRKAMIYPRSIKPWQKK
ncbi:MAG: hypothetical protein ACLR5N_06595 [Haemophilus parainfluenzae]